MAEATYLVYLKPKEARAIIDHVKYVSKHVLRDQLVMEIMWRTGARISEVVQLKPEHIGSNSIILRNEKQFKRIKQGKKTVRVHDPTAFKEVAITPDFSEELKRYVKLNNIPVGEYVFKCNSGKKPFLSRWYIWWVMGKAAESAQVFKRGKANPVTGPRQKAAYPHLFRHGAAMHLYRQTHNVLFVQKQLGHADIRSTQVYAGAEQSDAEVEIGKIKW